MQPKHLNYQSSNKSFAHVLRSDATSFSFPVWKGHVVSLHLDIHGGLVYMFMETCRWYIHIPIDFVNWICLQPIKLWKISKRKRIFTTYDIIFNRYAYISSNCVVQFSSVICLCETVTIIHTKIYFNGQYCIYSPCFYFLFVLSLRFSFMPNVLCRKVYFAFQIKWSPFIFVF